MNIPMRVEVDENSVRLIRDTVFQFTQDLNSLVRRTELIQRQLDALIASTKHQAIRPEKPVEPHTGRSGPRLLRISEVSECVGLARSTIWGLLGQGDFPEPRRMTGRSVRWLDHDIQQWIDSRPRGRRGAPAGTISTS